MVAALTGEPPANVTGRGTGLDDEAYRRKVAVVAQALQRHRPTADDPIGALAVVGGFEIAGLVGAILGAASASVPVLLDGFIVGAAALVASALCPSLPPRLVASHRSVEPGHAIALRHLGLSPLLELDLRLGEGTGAALAMGLVDAACAIRDEMATFQAAGVSERTGE
jgi:nicotinate-nucleotide--dimethylbenzimidazole phosphoribosyltransferase